MLEHLKNINVFSQILIPLIAAWLGSVIATRKFKKEKLWQEKYNAYQEILTAIDAMNYWAKEMATPYMAPSIGWFDGKKPYEIFSQARRQISKHICIGQLLISDNVIEKLKKLDSDIWNEEYRAEDDIIWDDDPQKKEELFNEHAKNIYEIIEKYLPDIISLSKEDLN